MIKRLSPVLFILFACGSGEKTPFCKCMESGEELNAFSAEMLTKDEVSQADEKKMKELKEAKSKVCKDYETMSGEEMLELKKACEGMDDDLPAE